MMKKLAFFVILILAIVLVSCSATAARKTVAYNSELKSLNTSELQGDDLRSALESLGVNTTTAGKLAEPRADNAKEIFVIASTDSGKDAPRLVLTSMHTEEGILFSVDAVWDEIPADRYLDILGVYFNIDISVNYSSDFTDAWIYYDGKTVDMKSGADYQLYNDERAVAISYDLGKLTKGMSKDKGNFVIHFDLYGMTIQNSAVNYNVQAYYDHGTNGYDRNIGIVKSGSIQIWKFDIKDRSSMSAVMYEMPCPSILTYHGNTK